MPRLSLLSGVSLRPGPGPLIAALRLLHRTLRVNGAAVSKWRKRGHVIAATAAARPGYGAGVDVPATGFVAAGTARARLLPALRIAAASSPHERSDMRGSAERPAPDIASACALRATAAAHPGYDAAPSALRGE